MQESITLNRDQILNKICSYLRLDRPILSSDEIHENIKEICVAKLCKTMGLKCPYNFRNGFFDNYSIITGEAVCEKLRINTHIASDNIRLIRYDSINFVRYVSDLFETEDIDEAIIDAFNFSQKYGQIISAIV
ncbi:MAG: hypothetical protein IKC49_03280 [Clostridia bacterium]|nr:hypothetical protein [Clostridia bacterium]